MTKISVSDISFAEPMISATSSSVCVSGKGVDKSPSANSSSLSLN